MHIYIYIYIYIYIPLGKLISSVPADDNDQEWTLTLQLQFFSLFDSGRHELAGEEYVSAMGD